ncbi:uncharacterized protein [Drosophila pseudoobscura]|uniref:Uncharacterized protein n=1 Tax=Drosophila pseudoobscura pseudoobscura TaxID=46245 RepID=A0A6I8W657_DROPS|nr:uncharacterized protein LOC26534232 [Drosophila pseudoobscura]
MAERGQYPQVQRRPNATEALWEGAKQEAVDRELIPSIPKAKVLFPIALQGERALKLLQRQNPGVLESEEKPLMEASCYMAHDRPAPQDELGSLVTEAGPKNHQLIISTDSNAHQNVWGSPDIKDNGQADISQEEESKQA